MPDPIDLQPNWVRHVVADQLEARMADPLSNINLTACEVVIEADHLLTGIHQPVDKMGAKETGSTCNQVAHEEDPDSRRSKVSINDADPAT